MRFFLSMVAFASCTHWNATGQHIHNKNSGNVGIGTSTPASKLTVVGNIRINSPTSSQTVLELGEGLDIAEGFPQSPAGLVSLAPGSVVVIDSEHPGTLTASTQPYDPRVAGIVAGAVAQPSAVLLGGGQSALAVALAGRVYCNVDATSGEVRPGDLLTTAATPAHAMKAVDPARARGAILGKAMQGLPKGHKGQILVLVTLQ
jgi:hypothetical protein